MDKVMVVLDEDSISAFKLLTESPQYKGWNRSEIIRYLAKKEAFAITIRYNDEKIGGKEEGVKNEQQ